MRRLVLPAMLIGAVAAAPAASAAKVYTYQVTSVQVSLVKHDQKPTGASKGDTIVYHDNLVNVVKQFGRAKGVKVGTDHGTMTFTSAHAAKFKGAANLPHGSLTLNGSVASVGNGVIAIPITGGSGAYAGAKGALFVGPGSKRALNIYRFTLAPAAPSGGNVA